MLDADQCRPTLGRPRSTEADEAIARAALTLLAESGFEGVTVEAVAQRAGVAKSTVYRRFPGKPELLVTVLELACGGAVDDPDTGSVERDLAGIADDLRRTLTETELGRAMPSVMAAAAEHPLIAAAQSRFVASRRAVSLAAVRRGIERQELDPDVDPEMLIDMVVGPIFHRLFVSRHPPSKGWIEDLVRRAVRGCQPVEDRATSP